MDIVQIKNNGVFADSLQIANNFGIQHKSVVARIESLRSEDEKIGSLTALSFYKDTQNRKQKMYLLNKDAFVFVVQKFKGKKAHEWQWKYIEAFNKMEALIKEKNSPDWQLTRQNGKMLRRGETNAIAEFVLYAGKNGSSNPDMYYKHFTELVNKTARINDYERDSLTPQLLFIVGTIEAKVTELITEMMERRLYYKDIYKIVKEQLKMLASFLPQHDKKYLPSPTQKRQLQLFAQEKGLV